MERKGGKEGEKGRERIKETQRLPIFFLPVVSQSECIRTVEVH